MTTAAGIPVVKLMKRKARNSGKTAAILTPANLMISPPDVIAEPTSAAAPKTAVDAPHPASHPRNAREQ
jgi:hypothetical protein